MPAPLLGYESNRYDALEAAEQVLWEGSPILSNPIRRYAAILIVFGIALVVVLAILVPWMAVLILTVIYAIFTLAWLLRRYNEQSTKSKQKYLITDRRFAVIHPQKALRMSMQPIDLSVVSLRISRKSASIMATGSASSVVFDRPPEPQSVMALLLSFPQRLGRRRLIRRGQPFAAPTLMPTMVQPMGDLQLYSGEILLWSGRPRAWDPINREWWINRLKLFRGAIVPGIISGVSFFFGYNNPSGSGPWIFGMIGALWMFAVLRNIFYEPFSSARRRRRTTYFLTNVRAVIELRAKQTEIRSILLDMTEDVSISTSLDGFGDITFQKQQVRFERVENAAEVHRILIDAIRAAGGPLPGQSALPASNA